MVRKKKQILNGFEYEFGRWVAWVFTIKQFLLRYRHVKQQELRRWVAWVFTFKQLALRYRHLKQQEFRRWVAWVFTFKQLVLRYRLEATGIEKMGCLGLYY